MIAWEGVDLKTDRPIGASHAAIRGAEQSLCGRSVLIFAGAWPGDPRDYPRGMPSHCLRCQELTPP